MFCWQNQARKERSHETKSKAADTTPFLTESRRDICGTEAEDGERFINGPTCLQSNTSSALFISGLANYFPGPNALGMLAVYKNKLSFTM